MKYTAAALCYNFLNLYWKCLNLTFANLWEYKKRANFPPTCAASGDRIWAARWYRDPHICLTIWMHLVSIFAQTLLYRVCIAVFQSCVTCQFWTLQLLKGVNGLFVSMRDQSRVYPTSCPEFAAINSSSPVTRWGQAISKLDESWCHYVLFFFFFYPLRSLTGFLRTLVCFRPSRSRSKNSWTTSMPLRMVTETSRVSLYKSTRLMLHSGPSPKPNHPLRKIALFFNP